MDDAYVIGIRLALENGVSEGVAAIRGELAALDRAVANSAVQLEALRRAAATMLLPASPAPLSVQVERPKAVQPKPALPDEPSSPARSEVSVVVAPQVLPRLDVVAPTFETPPLAPRAAGEPPRAEVALPAADQPAVPARADAPRTLPVAPAPPLVAQPASAMPAAPQTRVASPEAPRPAPVVAAPPAPLAHVAAAASVAPSAASPAPIKPTEIVVPPAITAPVMAPPAAAAPVVVTARMQDFGALGRQATALPRPDVVVPAVPVSVEAARAPLPTRVAVPTVTRDVAPQRSARSAAPVQSTFSADDRPAATPLLDRVSRTGRSVAPPAATPPDQRKAAAPQVPMATAPRLAPGAVPALNAALPSAVPPPDTGGTGRISGDVYLDGTRVGRWLADRMERDAGRPPVGPTFFDPRQSPAWGGATVGM